MGESKKMKWISIERIKNIQRVEEESIHPIKVIGWILLHVELKIYPFYLEREREE